MSNLAGLESNRRRFLNHVRVEDNCLMWVSTSKSKNYMPSFNIIGHGIERVNRAAYILFVGEIPNGLIVTTSCGKRFCVKSSHLVATTHSTACMWGGTGESPNSLAGVKKGT